MSTEPRPAPEPGPGPLMARLAAAVARGQQGDPAGARSTMLAMWEEVGDDGDPLHRCGVAHALADVHDDPGDELTWDERALAAAHQLSDEHLQAAGIGSSARSFLPSLHLNLADVRLRLGDLDEARRQVAWSRATIDELPEGDYRQMISGALDRVELAIDTS